MVVGVVTVITFYFVSITRLFLSQPEFYRVFSFFSDFSLHCRAGGGETEQLCGTNLPAGVTP